MASIEKRGGKYRAIFRFEGQKYSGSLGTDKRQKAELARGQIERNLELVSLGMLAVPDDCDVFHFFLTGQASVHSSHDGKPSNSAAPATGRLSISKLFELYFDAFLKESIEENSYRMLQTHRNNLIRLIGKTAKVNNFGTGDIQKYIDKRAKEKGRRGTIRTVTIKKEITTLSSIFEWAVNNGHVAAVPNKKGLRYPKGKEKLPFQTWDEIERKVVRGGLTDDQLAELWECLFLDTSQIHDLLQHVRLNARHQFIHPAFTFAAHTGARRSEIARSQISDLDFDGGMITIRELKRVRGMQSTRRVPMTPLLKTSLSDWLRVHPGGKMTFAMPEDVCRSRKDREIGSPLSPN